MTRSRTRGPEPARMDLPPLDVSTAAELGRYYQDFGPAVALVESGFHGSTDPDGIPLVRYPGGVEVFNAITAAQYALGLHTLVASGARERTDLLRRVLDRLVAEQTSSGSRAGLWEMRFDNPKYRHLTRPWASALAQGNAVSALLRGWQMFGEAGYREAAAQGIAGLHREDSFPGLVTESGEDLWYEEYPSAPPLHVLNGHVYALLGVLDHARDTGDEESHGRWRKAAETTRRALPLFDAGYWSVYDLHTRELVDEHYHRNIHIPQLRVLGMLTGQEDFLNTAARWEGYLGSTLCRLRRSLALRTAGVRKRMLGASRSS